MMTGLATINGGPLSNWLAACPPGRTDLWVRCPTCRAPPRSDGTACTGRDKHPAVSRAVRYYATYTGTTANLQAMHRAGMRLLFGPDQLATAGHIDTPPLPWCLDNGAWGAFKGARPWEPAPFREVLRRWGDGADFVIAPDVVAGGLASLKLSLLWLPELRSRVRQVLLAVQDGMSPADLQPHLSSSVGLFVGGSTGWKWQTLGAWAQLADETGCYLHVGRVNGAAKVQRCIDVGADSVDGTSPTRFSVTSPPLDVATQGVAHLPLFGGAL